MKVTEKEDTKKPETKEGAKEAGKEQTKDVKETKDADTLTFEGTKLCFIIFFL